MSEWRTASVHNVPDAIVYAANNLRAGDILLIETQLTVNRRRWPVEVETANYQAVRVATAKGISVVEPAGNGYSNLADFVHPTYGRVLDPGDANGRDSVRSSSGPGPPALRTTGRPSPTTATASTASPGETTSTRPAVAQAARRPTATLVPSVALRWHFGGTSVAPRWHLGCLGHHRRRGRVGQGMARAAASNWTF
jgi:hypothetical protein